MVEFSCAACKSRLQAPDDRAGQPIACARCGTQMVVPGSAVEAGVAANAKSDGIREAVTGEKQASTPSKDPKGAAKTAPALGSIKRFDSQMEQASRALIDALAVTEKDTNPAIFLKDNYLGGRTQRGLSMEFLKGTAALILTVAFAWLYVFPVLWLMGSAWQFLPLRKTEFLSIGLRRRARLSSIIPFAIAYFARLIAGNVVIGLLLLLATCLSSVAAAIVKDATPMLILGAAALVASVLGSLWYFYCNYALFKLLRNIDEEGLLEYQAVLEYGYPRKVALIKGISSAGLETQLAGLMTLCDTLSKTEFSPWDQVTVHNARQGFISKAVGGLKSLVTGG